MAALAVGIVACLVVITRPAKRPGRIANCLTPLCFNPNSGFPARTITTQSCRKLGNPAEDRWKSEAGELQYRLLRYPERGLSVVLMGTEREKALYSARSTTTDVRSTPYPLPSGKDTYSILRSLRTIKKPGSSAKPLPHPADMTTGEGHTIDCSGCAFKKAGLYADPNRR